MNPEISGLENIIYTSIQFAERNEVGRDWAAAMLIAWAPFQQLVQPTEGSGPDVLDLHDMAVALDRLGIADEPVITALATFAQTLAGLNTPEGHETAREAAWDFIWAAAEAMSHRRDPIGNLFKLVQSLGRCLLTAEHSGKFPKSDWLEAKRHYRNVFGQASTQRGEQRDQLARAGCRRSPVQRIRRIYRRCERERDRLLAPYVELILITNT